MSIDRIVKIQKRLEECAISKPDFYEYQFDFIGNILASDAILVGKYGFPALTHQKLIPDVMPLPMNYMLSDKNISKNWYHCFVGDEQFERYWHNFDKYVPYIRSAKGLISTDFSIYRDIPKDTQIRNCYRNRVLAYTMQKINPNIIPTAGFGGEDTWEWCFDSLPKHSTYAITTNGVLSDPEGRRLFIGGVDALVLTLEPYALVVCGNYPKWLDTKYPGVRIIPILSYSQMWSARRYG